MTCVAAIAQNGIVYMAADSAGVGGWDLTLRRDPKIYKRSGFLIGFTHSFRMGQVLGYSLTVDQPDPHVDSAEFMCTTFVDAVRACLKAAGFTKIENNEERGGHFLVGWRGEIFNVQGDFQVARSLVPFDAVGCGEPYALGSLATSKGSPPTRLNRALEVAEQFSAGVRGPFIQERIK